MRSREQKTLVGDTALEILVLSPFQADSEAGPVPECLCAKPTQGPASGPGSCAPCSLTRGLTAAPREAQGKMQSLGSRTLTAASYTPGSSSCATGNPEERGGSGPASPNDLHWCQRVFASAQLLQPGAFLGLPQPSPLTGGRERNPRASPPPGQLENIRLRDCCLERFGDKGKWDSRISTFALVSLHCTIYFNPHLPASWLPWAAAHWVFLFLLQMNSCLFRAKWGRFFAF